MWLSKKMAQALPEERESGGIVSVGGENPAVVTDGESRGLGVISPGGYVWRPGVDQQVLVLQGHVLGALQAEASLAPGEVLLYSGGASIRLGNDGSIRLTGDIYINGERWESGGSSSA